MKKLCCLVATFVLWMLLFWSLEIAVIVGGIVFAAAVSLVFGAVYPDDMQKVLNPKRVLWFLAYLPYFLWCVIRANVDVMIRVIPPEMPIHPGIVKVTTTLKSEMAKTFLANSITLTPGTLTVDIDGQDLYIHWINVTTDDPAERSAEICGRFEPLLRRIFE